MDNDRPMRGRRCSVCGHRRFIRKRVYEDSEFTIGGNAGWICTPCRRKVPAADDSLLAAVTLLCWKTGKSVSGRRDDTGAATIYVSEDEPDGQP